MMTIQQALARVVDGDNLTREEMAAVMRQIMTGETTDAQIGGFLTALRMKGETIAELAGAAQVMRELVTRVEVPGDQVVDLVGTGGDGANLFNVSTAASFVVAAAGGKVAKHGNRSVSSTSGSSDVLEELGMPLELTPGQVARTIQEVGIGFMFAPAHHTAMRHAVGPRRELAMRTLFNILGPLTNPAGVQRQVIGVHAAPLCRQLAEVLCALGASRAMIVHGEDGLDEISIATATRVAELRDDEITEYRITPEEFGIERESLEGLSVDSAAESAALILGAFGGSGDARAVRAGRMIAINAASCLYVAGIARDLKSGYELAEDLIATGQVREKLKEFIDFTRFLSEGRL